MEILDYKLLALFGLAAVAGGFLLHIGGISNAGFALFACGMLATFGGLAGAILTDD